MSEQKLHLIPYPKKIIRKEGKINLKDFSLSVEGGLKEIGKKYQKELSLPKDKAKRISLEKVSTEEEGYILKINREKIKINASDEKGFFYCLQTLVQLKDGDIIPQIEIEDAPSLKTRGFHINLNALRQTGFKEAKELIETSAKFKLNTILVEYGDRFPFRNHSSISSSNSLTIKEIIKLNQIAKENFIEVTPLLQSFGHLGYVLDHKEYRHLKEGGKGGDAQLCPLNPDSFKLFTELADEILRLHPEGKQFHIGADETSHLGECPQCKREVEKIGKGGLYVNYINRICQWVKEQGRIPILWDDILCRYPETLDKLDKDAIIMYWDYWTTQEKSPILASAIPRGVVYDKRWNEEWKGELPNLEREILRRFARPIDLELEKNSGKRHLSLFRKYLGKDFPKYITSFPYLKFYQDKGYKVIGAPTTLDSYFVKYPNHQKLLSNIKEFSRRCVKEESDGIVTTVWGNFPHQTLYLGLIATSQFTWKGHGRMKIEYRNIEEKDIPSIAEILNSLFSGEWYRKITPDFFREKVTGNPYFSFKETFVATIEEKIAGFAIHISEDKEIGHLHSLCVRREYQNKGIGKELLKRIEKFAKGNGEKELCIDRSSPGRLYLGMDAEDKRAVDFFLRQGYKTREEYYSEGIYALNLKNYFIREKVIQREKELENRGYRINFVKDDKRITSFCLKKESKWGNPPPPFATIMEKDKEIVGFCGYSLKDEKGMGGWGPFLVSSGERGKGIGTVIICRSLKEMSEKGCSSAFLQSGGSKSEGSGPRMYRKLGFKLVKEWLQMKKTL